MKEVSKKVILLKKNKANSYQLANVKVMETNANPEIIGTSLSAVNTMTACEEEMQMIMPDIIGVGPTSPEWKAKVKDYWNSICVPVTGGGKDLEIGFKVDVKDKKKKAFIDLLPEPDRKSDEALANYINRELEKDLKFYADIYMYATPIVPVDYLLYRYCMGYRDVANNHNNVDTHPHIRLYIFDQEVANKVIAKDASVKREVTGKLAELYNKRELLLDVLYAFESDSVTQGETQQDIAIDRIATDTPVEFLATVKDKNLTNKAMIQKYIKAGILNKVPLTTHILDGETKEVLGEDMDRTLLWFNTKTNDGTVADYAKRFKELTK